MTLNYRGYEVTRKENGQFTVKFDDIELTYEKLSDSFDAIDRLKMDRLKATLKKTLEEGSK